jgi:hypothetical protein
LPIRIYKAALPAEVPGAIFDDGHTTVILANERYIDEGRNDWLREVLNSLLAEADTNPRPRLRQVV